ncbi:MAG: GtrA family protein [Betaproteobacteria bacterium]|nr:GtrA family protein [Betaproteobacteria bacterium]MDE2621819.1 GtrA family protein [Betaproteobacteria bacterium]
MNARAREILWFAVAGTLGFVVDASVVTLLRSWAGAGFVSAKAVGFTLAVTVTWALNRRLAFAGAPRRHPLRQWGHYVWTNGLGGLVNNGTYLVAVFSVDAFARQPALAVALGSLAGMFFNYLAARHWVFRSNSR